MNKPQPGGLLSRGQRDSFVLFQMGSKFPGCPTSFLCGCPIHLPGDPFTCMVSEGATFHKPKLKLLITYCEGNDLGRCMEVLDAVESMPGMRRNGGLVGPFPRPGPQEKWRSKTVKVPRLGDPFFLPFA